MTVQQIETRLQRAGATDTEASDLAEIMYANGWAFIAAHKPSVEVLAAMGTWLADWQAERGMVAANVRAERKARIDAGYRSVPVADPVRLNGVTEW